MAVDRDIATIEAAHGVVQWAVGVDQPPATGSVKDSCACVVGKAGPRQNDSATVAGNAAPGAQADAPASQEIDIQCARAGTDAHAVCQCNTADGLERERSIATTGLGDIGIDRDVAGTGPGGRGLQHHADAQIQLGFDVGVEYVRSPWAGGKNREGTRRDEHGIGREGTNGQVFRVEQPGSAVSVLRGRVQAHALHVKPMPGRLNAPPVA